MGAKQKKPANKEISKGIKFEDSSITPKTAQNKAEWEALKRDLERDLN